MSVGISVNLRALEKSFCVLEKSWKSPGNLFLNKSTNPDTRTCGLRTPMLKFGKKKEHFI